MVIGIFSVYGLLKKLRKHFPNLDLYIKQLKFYCSHTLEQALVILFHMLEEWFITGSVITLILNFCMSKYQLAIQ